MEEKYGEKIRPPIESDIPIPKAQHGRAGNLKYPLDEMEEGDSFFLEGYSREKMQSIQASIAYYRRKYNKEAKFEMRKVEEKGKEGIRLWRTA